MKKFLALLIALVMMCGMLAACGESEKTTSEKDEENAEETSEKAPESIEAKLKRITESTEEIPYNITVTANFESDNEEFNSILSMMNMEIPASFDGKNMSMDMNMTIMDYPITAKIIVADMVMYYDMEMMGEKMKMKASLSDEQFEEFMGESNVTMAVDYEDFVSLTVEERDGKTYITCDEIKEEGLKKLNGVMAESLGEVDANIEVSDIDFNIILSDDKYECMELSCVYLVTFNGESVNIAFAMNAEFSYDNVPKITAPADADAYQEIDADELIG